MCNVDSSQYQVILTSGATAGLKLVGAVLGSRMLGAQMRSSWSCDTDQGCIRRELSTSRKPGNGTGWGGGW
jgi:hypothetical protein